MGSRQGEVLYVDYEDPLDPCGHTCPARLRSPDLLVYPRPPTKPEQRHPTNNPAVFREYVQGDIWTGDHLGEYFDFTAKACAIGSRHNEVEYGRRRSLVNEQQQIYPDPGRSEATEGGPMKMRAEGHIARGGVERESTAQAPPSEGQSEQYSLAKILGIWAAAALLMGGARE